MAPLEGTCILLVKNNYSDKSEEDHQVDFREAWNHDIQKMNQQKFNGSSGIIEGKVEFFEKFIEYYNLFMNKV